MAGTPAASVRTPGRAAFVVLGGGSGSRLGADVNKVYLPLGGRRVISWSFVWAAQVAEFGHFVLVVRPEDAGLARETLHRDVPGLEVDLVHGGSTRHGSEQAALDHLTPRILAGEIEVVALHDGARPLAGPQLLRDVVTTAAQVGGALPAVPAGPVIAVDAAGAPGPGPDGRAGRRLVRVQTPQAFRAPALLDAYRAAGDAGYEGTDTASSMEAFSDLPVQIVAGHRHNLKVTYADDLPLAERLLATLHHSCG